MRSAIAAALLLSGCLDLDALYRGSTSADLSSSATVDLAETRVDLSSGVDLGGPDLGPTSYWVTTFSGGPGSKSLRGIAGFGGSIVAVGDNGTLILSTDGGGSWAKQNSNSNTDFTSVWLGSAASSWLVGSGGKIYYYNGTPPMMAGSVPNLNYAAVFGINPQQVIAVGDDPNMGGQLATGITWKAITHGLNAKQHGMWGLTDRLWSFGENATGGYYLLSTLKWTPQPIAASRSNITFRAGWGTSDIDVWTVGTEGNISHFTESPPFQPVPSGVTATLNGVWGIGPSNIWAVGDAGTIVHYDGKSWQRWTNVKDITGAESLQAIWGNGTNLWTVSDRGNIYRCYQ